MSFTRAGDLLGAWRLESAVEVFDDGERRDEFGPSPEGYLCYHPAGIVSATLGDPARPPVPAGDPQSGTDSDYGKIARHFIAYAGPFSADPGNATVTHHVDVSLFPNWQGQDQVRRVTIDGRRLSIIASDRTAADGRTFHYVYQTAGKDHCHMVSISDVLTPTGWTTVQVIWDLKADPIDDKTSKYTNTVTTHPTAEFMDFIASHGQTFEEAATTRQAASGDHCRRETPLFAASIARHANATK